MEHYVSYIGAPLQIDTSDMDVEPVEADLKEKCMKCGEEFGISNLRQHVASCGLQESHSQ